MKSKQEKRGYSRIQELEACREEMISAANIMEKRISTQRRRIYRRVANVAESAEECMATVQSLVRRRQLTLYSINSEVTKVSKVIKFEGYSYPHSSLAATTRGGNSSSSQGFIHQDPPEGKSSLKS